MDESIRTFVGPVGPMPEFATAPLTGRPIPVGRAYRAAHRLGEGCLLALRALLEPTGFVTVKGDRMHIFLHFLRSRGFVITEQRSPDGLVRTYHFAAFGERESLRYQLGPCHFSAPAQWDYEPCECIADLSNDQLGVIYRHVQASAWRGAIRRGAAWSALSHALARILSEHGDEVVVLVLAACELECVTGIAKLEPFARAVAQAMAEY